MQVTTEIPNEEGLSSVILSKMLSKIQWFRNIYSMKTYICHLLRELKEVGLEQGITLWPRLASLMLTI